MEWASWPVVKYRWLGMVALAGLVTAAVSGCRQEPRPTTYPVTGKVLCQDGRPFAGGVIQFLSKSEPDLTMRGDIQEDGTFEVYTLFRSDKLPGAVEGSCQVMITAHPTENQPIAIFQPPQIYTIRAEANSFVIRAENAPTPR